MALSTLTARYPGIRSSLPVVSLGQYPTPVEEHGSWGERLGVPSLWVKRDDLSGPIYGGNKVRKLEGLLGQAIENERRWVFTAGAWGSHHVLATSFYARQEGLRCGAVLIPQPETEEVRRNLACTAALADRLVPVISSLQVPGRLTWEGWRHQAEIIPPGGSNPRSVLAYAGAALELADQIARGICPRPDRIYVTLGSGSTLAGLLLGQAIQPIANKIIGIRVTNRAFANRLTVGFLAHRAARWLKKMGGLTLPDRWLERELNIAHDQFGRGYGYPTSGGEAALLEAGQHGVTLDPTYTAKTVAGLAADVQRERPAGPVLYWHTLNSRPLPARDEPSRADALHPSFRRVLARRKEPSE